jgi:EAL domain-containing protein (putative c-di-GMP-specific phosphodiesterase class I)
MFSPEKFRDQINSWVNHLFSEDSHRVSIVFSVAQTSIGIQSFTPGDLQQIRDRLHSKFANNVRYIGVANFHLTPLFAQLDAALDDLNDIQEKLRLPFHIGIGVPTDDPIYALKSASDAWIASLRINENGATVNFSHFFSRDEISDFILEKGQNKFDLFFQPKICGNTNKVFGYEALARLLYDGTHLPPSENNSRSCDFLKAVSANGLQKEFDFWLINRIAPHVNENVNISINLLASALTEELADLIIGVIDQRSLGCLDIEILEHELLTKSALEIIQTLSSKGVLFSVDDFGKGVSNIEVLQWLPSGSTVKVDRDFVRDSDLDTDDAGRKRKTQRAIADLAKIYGQNIVFEGVENEAIFEALVSLVDDLKINRANVKFQGYFRGGQPAPLP